MFNFDPTVTLKIAVPVLLGLTVHECAHGWAALKLGDSTAQRAGRLTLNPLPHLDLLGTLMLFVSNFIGWAKPVPVNPRYFKNPVRDMSLVALAGPVSNLLLALAFSLALHVLARTGLLDALPALAARNLFDILLYGVVINIGLSVFNLLPIPPLDGFRVLAYFLPWRWTELAMRYQLALFLALLLLMYLGVLRSILEPVRSFLLQLVL